MKEPSHPKFETGADDQPIVQSSQHPEWFSQPKKPPSPDRDWNKTLPAVHGSIQLWISELAKQANTPSSFNELMDTPLDFSNFIMNRLKVDTLTPELLAGPTYDLVKGSCKNIIELEYHLEEVYKAITDQLDWVNPEGQQYPHNLLQPLPLILTTEVVVLFHLRTSSTTTSSIFVEVPLAVGVSHWGRKCQQFYGFAVNRESARDVYSKRRIIVVTELKIVEWHSYKHLDWITVRRDDDKLYKFKEGDLKRLRIQDIEDMLLLLVQGKLTNLMVEERFAFNVSLMMFTRSIVIQRRVEDLQLGQKNRLMRIDELHKFSDRTLIDVRTALDDRLKGIQMQYLPQTIWRQSDKDRAAAMIQAIDKRLKTRRVMRSLESDEVLKIKNFKKDKSKSYQVIKSRKAAATATVAIHHHPAATPAARHEHHRHPRPPPTTIILISTSPSPPPTSQAVAIHHHPAASMTSSPPPPSPATPPPSWFSNNS
nr:hypothetical protein [Tanacetum cinerariifolium]